jgi:hypothetical protein
MSLRARDVIGRRIVAVRQQRFSNYDHLGQMGYELQALVLDNGRSIYFSAVETEVEPYVDASLTDPPERTAKGGKREQGEENPHRDP